VASSAEGASEANILRAFPTLTPENVQAVAVLVASLALKHLNGDADDPLSPMAECA
jgi:uncharacterized protein (DUF433 family)